MFRSLLHALIFRKLYPTQLYPTQLPAISILAIVLFTALFGARLGLQPARSQAIDASPPAEAVRLVFVHHSTGENWLRDDDGGMGRALAENNYFVSDTNYGWGPDSIGDRTDIVNWPEWFLADQSSRYLQALFEEADQHSDYTRTFDNPGGENEIIMFKSCFPNSALEGSPGDPPQAGDELTVGNARYIYNQLLTYFITRPDKLFVVITAPPLMDDTYGANARAFNTWLVRDWLAENNYPYSNVAVFDFYNVLTDPDNHHRIQGGLLEYTNNQGGNNAYYPSGDDHPNREGNRKATTEFLPMLNYFYQRWKANLPPEPVLPATEAAGETPVESVATEAPVILPGPGDDGVSQPYGGDIIDLFESGAPAHTNGWITYFEDGSQTTIDCTPQAEVVHWGSQALHINFDVKANSWATCSLFYDPLQNWSKAAGIVFYLRASQPGLIFNLDLFGGSHDQTESYSFTIEAPPDSAKGWIQYSLHWDELRRVEWEENAGAPFANPEQIVGIGFGFSTYPDTPNTGEIWIDDLTLIVADAVDGGAANQNGAEVQEAVTEAATPVQPVKAAPTAQPAATQAEKAGGRRLCPSVAAPLVLVGAAFIGLKRRRRI